MSRFAALVSEEGHLIPHEPERLRAKRGKHVYVSVHEQPTMGVRSNGANRFLWGVIYAEIAAATGNDPETVHYACKREAVRVGVLEPQFALLGDKLYEADPTTRTDPEAFADYIHWLREGCATGSLLGQVVVIPDSDL